MRQFIFATLIATASIFSGVSASAADLPMMAPPSIASPFSWTGVYVGGNVGAMRGNADFDPICLTPPANCPLLFPSFAAQVFAFGPPTFFSAFPGGLPGGSTKGSSFVGGAQAGYNYQVGHFVFGVEGDADAAHIRTSLGRNTALTFVIVAPFTATVAANSTVSNDWIASLRTRVGYTWDRFMVYGTGGVAFTNVGVSTTYVYTPPSAATTVLPGPAGGRSSQNLVGWIAGVGAEWAFDNSASVAAEYRHSDFGNHSFALGTDVAGVPFATGIKYTTDQATLRLNWRWAGK